jgi:outer membrane receptor protein involved in Fe transport
MNKPIRGSLRFAVGVALVTGASTSFAQQPAGGEERAQPQPAQTLDEVVITGTRIRRDDFSNTQPTTVIGSGLMQDLGINNAGDAVAQLPSNVGSWTPTAKPGGNDSFPANVFNGLNIANLRGLNPRYGSRTLTLVDSRRHVPTNQGDGVDLNMIPTVLIDRMEAVTGGASASYGSGAIGGVLNILLDRDLDGVKAEIDFSETDRHDGDDKRVGFAYGTPIGDASHFVLGVESQRLGDITNCMEKRDWCRRNGQVRTNPNYATDNLPNYVYAEDIRLATSTSGVFPLLNRQLDATGTQLLPFTNPNALGVGGDGQPIYSYTTLRSNVDRDVVYASFDHDISDSLKLYADASLGHVESWTPQRNIDITRALLRPDNYYLTRLPVNPCSGLANLNNCRITKDLSAQSQATNDTQTDLRRAVIGLTGGFGDSSWTWDVYYAYGKSETLQAVYDSPHSDRFLMAIDAVDDGTGNPVCRVTRDGFFNVYGANTTVDPTLAVGCVPTNIFGLTPFTPEQKAYTFGRILENTHVNQDMVEFVSSGELADGFGSAGSIRAAAGMSWRDESIANPADRTQPDAIRKDYNSQFGESFGGDVEVWELFGELDVPITQKFDITAAARTSSYTNTAGEGTGVEGQVFDYDIDTWKVNANWAPLDVLRVRVSRSRDVRAPNFRELYYRKVFPSGSLYGWCSNPWTGAQAVLAQYNGDACVVDLRGGSALTPEKADTDTVGVVITPQGLDFRFAIDYFDIVVHDAISPAASNLALDSCFLGRDPLFCSQITGTLLNPADPLGGFSDIASITPLAMNLRSYESAGYDLSAEWQHDYDFGQISLRVLATHTAKQLIQASVTSPLLTDIAGVTGTPGGGSDWEPAAEWNGQLIGSWRKGPVRLTAQARYISDGRVHQTRIGPDDPSYNEDALNSLDSNRVPGYVDWSLNGSYQFTARSTEYELFGSIRNLFDQDPPLVGAGVGGTNSVLFDTVGRTYSLGLRVAF